MAEYKMLTLMTAVSIRTIQLCSVYLIVAISIDRYIAICHPEKAIRFFSLARARKITTFIFVISSVCTIPRVFLVEISDLHNVHMTEYKEIYMIYQSVPSSFTKGTFWYIYLMANLVLLVPIPLLCLLVTNTLIVVQMRRMIGQTGPLTRAQKSEMAIARIAVAIVVIFGISSAAYVGVEHFYPRVSLSATTLININVILSSVINFILYCSMSHMFRQEFVKLFCACCSARTLERNPSSAPNDFGIHLESSPCPRRL